MSRQRYFSDEQKAIIERLYPSEINREKIVYEVNSVAGAEFTDWTWRKIKDKAHNMGIPRLAGAAPLPEWDDIPDTEIELPDLKKPIYSWTDFVKAALEIQDTWLAADTGQGTATVWIKSNVPVGMVCTSDWHLGSLSTDYRSWLKDMLFMVQCPYLKAVINGDETDNFRRFPNLACVLGQAIPPQMQLKLLKSLLTDLVQKKKIAMTGWGNHQVDFDERAIGQSLWKVIMEDTEIVHLDSFGFVRVYVGCREPMEVNPCYTWLLVHKSRFRSFYHALHSSKREYEMRFPADIILTSHDHIPGIEYYWKYPMAREMGYPFGGRSFLIRSGTYKTQDKWGQRYFSRGIIGAPVVVLYPESHQMEVFDNASSAAIFIEAEIGGIGDRVRGLSKDISTMVEAGPQVWREEIVNST